MIATVDVFKRWFWAAAIYNFVWGLSTLVWPQAFFSMTRMDQPNYPFLWQVVGMFVLVFAPAYAWAARDPFRFRQIIFIGFLGKLFGLVGYVWYASRGALPPIFGITVLTNDLIWLPAFYLFLARAAKEVGGWTRLAAGA